MAKFRARRVWVTHKKWSCWMWELSLPGVTPAIYPSLGRLMDRVYSPTGCK